MSDSAVTSDSEAFLRHFHAHSPGATTRTFASGRDSQGHSSYARLAQSVAQTDGHATIVDIACGDGYLLEMLHERLPNARLIGIDMSAEELHAARARLGPDIDLRCERAQATSVATGSVDCVVSHLALMLMQPIEAVIGQLHRILRPAGLLAAVVGSDVRLPGALEEFFAIARGLASAPTAVLGDRRVRTADGLRELFAATGTWRELAIDTFEINLDGPWPRVEAILFDTYVPNLLEPAFREPLRRATAQRIPALADADGIVPCRIGLRLMRFQRLPVTDQPF
ncbi:MAG: class I SAM-dependent methyltransferase [Casimicrobiaceae bacterium]